MRTLTPLTLLCLAALLSCGSPVPPALTGPPHIESVEAYFDGPLPAQTSEVLAVYTGLPVRVFAHLGSGKAPLTWLWDFGGGVEPGFATDGSGDIHSPYTPGGGVKVTPVTPGTYHANVTVTNAQGTDSFAFTLAVAMPPAPEFDPLSYLPDRAYAARRWTLTAENALIAEWHWDFGGGATPNELTQLDYNLIEFGAAGNYPASVTVTNPAGSHTYPFTLRVRALEPPKLSIEPVLNWDTGRYAFLQVENNLGPADTWLWDFGGAGDPDWGNIAFPVTTAAAPGTYVGSVTASNAAGSDTVQFTIIVHD